MTDRRPPERKLQNPRCCLTATSGDTCGEFKLANIHNDSTTEINQNTHTPEMKPRVDVELQTLPLKTTSFQNAEPLRKSFEKIKLRANQYSAPMTLRTFKTKM